MGFSCFVSGTILIALLGDRREVFGDLMLQVSNVVDFNGTRKDPSNKRDRR